jgi:hypothetical protein
MALFSRKKAGRSPVDGSLQTGRNLGRQPVRSYGNLHYGEGAPLAGQRERNPARRTPTAPQSQAFSYHANRSMTELNIGREMPADQPVARRLPGGLRRMLDRTAWLAGGVLVIALITYQMQLSGKPAIVSLVPASDTPFLRETDIYARAAGALIDGSALNRNKLTVNTTAIADGMLRQFPELQSVTVSLPLLGHTPTFYLKPADPALVLASGDDSFVIDLQGRALSRAASTSQLERLNIPTVTDQSDVAVGLGRQTLPRRTAAFVAGVSRQLRASDVSVKAMIMPAGASELHVYVNEAPYYIKYNIQDEAGEAAEVQTGTYLAVRKYLSDKARQPAQYIDVRLQGRAYYK